VQHARKVVINSAPVCRTENVIRPNARQHVIKNVMEVHASKKKNAVQSRIRDVAKMVSNLQKTRTPAVAANQKQTRHHLPKNNM